MIGVYVGIYLFIRNLVQTTTDRMRGITLNKRKDIKTDYSRVTTCNLIVTNNKNNLVLFESTFFFKIKTDY